MICLEPPEKTRNNMPIPEVINIPLGDRVSITAATTLKNPTCTRQFLFILDALLSIEPEYFDSFVLSFEPGFNRTFTCQAICFQNGFVISWKKRRKLTVR